jgi:NADH dehydrogenase FAD-containing subunit
MPYDTIFDKFPGELKVASVSSIDENKTLQGGRVILKTGEQITYDVLAVATGSSWQGFISFPSEQALYEEHIQLWRNKFAKAEDIVIVGGGAVGIGKGMTLFFFPVN